MEEKQEASLEAEPGAETGVDSLDGGGTMAGMEDITWPFVALMAVLVAGQAVFIWLASR
jgi:hypothetical protein